LFAAGAAALVQWGFLRSRLAQGSCIGVLLVAGLLALPFGLPILAPATMARYCSSFGLQAAVTTNRGHLLPLPQDYADMIGWEDQVKAVAEVMASLPAAQRTKAGLMARNYGEAGALEFYGKRHGLTETIMLPDNYLIWPADTSREVVVTIGIPPGDLAGFFKHVRTAARFDHPWMVEEERDQIICVADTPIRDLHEGWKQH
jgi:hypothetical protein